MSNACVVPKAEYPRMQFRREGSWINLNGEWDIYFDYGRSGEDRKVWNTPELFDKKVVVPFCVESKLSGLEHKDYVESLYYRREIVVPQEWEGKKILLNFGGVDFYTSVRIDGVVVGTHKGGSVSFSIDISKHVKVGQKHILTIHVEDYTRDSVQGVGKQQLHSYYPTGARYTRVTGIWQTVWLEAVAETGLVRCKITPDFDNESISFCPTFFDNNVNNTFEAKVFADGVEVAKGDAKAVNGAALILPIKNVRPWSPDDPYLYDIELSVVDSNGNVLDKVDSYTGIRKFEIIGNRFYLNNEPIFLRWVLDQGFYPEGIWTSPSDEALKHDIEMSMAAGFNGARLHQKVFEERYHYWADKLGYLTSAEYSDWGINLAKIESCYNVINGWKSCVIRDMNHPSIVMWTPLNEECKREDAYAYGFYGNYRNLVLELESLTNALDNTRPFHDASGWYHINPKIFSVHPYCASAEELTKRMHPEQGKIGFEETSDIPYDGQPLFVDEWGGFRYVPGSNCEGWGYNGIAPKSDEDFCNYISEQESVMRNDDAVAGYCYTQLTDVEQEQNGVYFYDRRPKVPVEMLRAIFSQKPDWSKW